MPPLFDKNQQLDESELVDSLTNKAPRSHKAILVSQGFNTETGDLATFIEHCEWSQTTDNIAMAKFSASDKDSEIKRHKNRSNFKEHEQNSMKHRKKNSSMYCSLHGENKSHTYKECNVLKKRAKYKENSQYGRKYYKKKFKELNLLQEEAAHQRATFKNLNKDFTKDNYLEAGTRKAGAEELAVILTH